MHRADGISSPWAVAVGAFLLVQGIWGLFSPVVFGVLTTNSLHAVIHLVLGAAGIHTGMKGGAREFSMFVGIVLLAVGVFWSVPLLSGLVVSTLNVNREVAYVSIVIGITSLLVPLASGRSREA